MSDVINQFVLLIDGISVKNRWPDIFRTYFEIKKWKKIEPTKKFVGKNVFENWDHDLA